MDWVQAFSEDAMSYKGSEIRELLKVLADPEVLSFAGGIPDPELFPVAKTADVQSQIMADSKRFSAAFQYSQTEGYAPLRRWVAETAGGDNAGYSADNILITNGAQQSLSLLARTLMNPGDKVAVANPTYLGALQILGGRRPSYLTCDTDSDGLIPDSVKQAFEAGARILYTIPDFQNPGGFTLTEERRLEILKLAHEFGVIIIEDTAYSDLYFDAPPPPSMRALEVEALEIELSDRLVIQVGTFSKTLMPALRVGWTIGAPALINKMVVLKQSEDLHTSTINQMTGYELASSILSQHVSGLRNAYAHRRNVMLEALDQFMPETVQYTRPGGGMFVWLVLPEGMDGVSLLEKALSQEKIAFVPGSAFYANGEGQNTVRLCFSTCSDEQIMDGISRLAKLITS